MAAPLICVGIDMCVSMQICGTNAGCSSSQNNLGNAYCQAAESGLGEPHAMARSALRSYERAASQGHPGSMYNIGRLWMGYNSSAIRKDVCRATYYFQLAADRGAWKRESLWKHALFLSTDRWVQRSLARAC